MHKGEARQPWDEAAEVILLTSAERVIGMPDRRDVRPYFFVY